MTIPGTTLPLCALCEDDAATVQSADIGDTCAECATIVGIVTARLAHSGLTVCAAKSEVRP